MNTRKGRLGFELPVVVENPNENPAENPAAKLNTSPEWIRQWCENLVNTSPGTKPEQVAKEVYFALMEILQAKLTPQELFVILEFLQVPVQLVCQNLKKHSVDKVQPLQAQPLDDRQLLII